MASIPNTIPRLKLAWMTVSALPPVLLRDPPEPQVVTQMDARSDTPRELPVSQNHHEESTLRSP